MNIFCYTSLHCCEYPSPKEPSFFWSCVPKLKGHYVWNSGGCSRWPYPMRPGTQHFWIFLYFLAKLDKYLWTMWSGFFLQGGAVQVMHLAEPSRTCYPECSTALMFSCRVGLCWTVQLLGSAPILMYPYLLVLTATNPLRVFSDSACQVGKAGPVRHLGVLCAFPQMNF